MQRPGLCRFDPLLIDDPGVKSVAAMLAFGATDKLIGGDAKPVAIVMRAYMLVLAGVDDRDWLHAEMLRRADQMRAEVDAQRTPAVDRS